jgi:hypothetical protein
MGKRTNKSNSNFKKNKQERISSYRKQNEIISDNISTSTMDNSDGFFKDFYRLFNEFKYNLVALNKRFDVLDTKLKNFVNRERTGNNIIGSNHNHTHNNHTGLSQNRCIYLYINHLLTFREWPCLYLWR